MPRFMCFTFDKGSKAVNDSLTSAKTATSVFTFVHFRRINFKMNYFSLFYPSKFPARSSNAFQQLKHHSHWSIRWVRFHAFLTCLHLKDALLERPKIVHAAGIPDFSTNALNSSSACPNTP
jgi:hypothetical protein